MVKRACQNLPQRMVNKSEFHELPLKINNFKRMKILFVFMIVLWGNQLLAQSTIADARRGTVGETVTISGIVLNGDELGSIKYVQDTSAGIAVFDDKLANVKRGDSITVTGELDDYYNLLEIKNISSFTVLSSVLVLPDPHIISISEIGEDYESQLVRIEDIELEGLSGTFAGGKNYNFTDGTNSGELRIGYDSPMIGKPMPSGNFNLVAICSQWSTATSDTRNGYQLLPRDMNDFISGSSINITTAVQVVAIGTTSIDLFWGTDIAGDAYVRYGSSNNLESLTNYKAGDSTTGETNNHVVEITGLEPSEIIYAQVFNVNGNDTAFSSIGVYVSESNSSGKINVYFNSSVDETLATETVAKDIGNAMEDTLTAYINQTEESIDFCIYNFDNSTISDALNAAYNRGVKIRFITCASTNHYGVNDLHAEIPVLERPEVSEGGIMHNKFAIFDGNSANANQSWVWSGSTNLTQGQLFSDANNMIFIQDQSLALTYEIEFEEMWGSTSDQANTSNAKFGDRKTNNTPHELLIGGNRVECYFSPSDNTNQKLIDAMATADYDLHVQTMLITRTDLANAIIAAADRGTEVNVITDDKRDNSETVNDILSELPTDKYIFDDDVAGTLHHKMAIIDAKTETSDPLVISGSHNWSNSANDRNDENTLIIHDTDIANQYYQQFAYRFKQNGGNLVVSAEAIKFSDLKIFPNPTADRIQISTNQELQHIKIYSINGVLVQDIIPSGSHTIEIDLGQQNSGIYLLKIESAQNQINTYKIIKN